MGDLISCPGYPAYRGMSRQMASVTAAPQRQRTLGGGIPRSTESLFPYSPPAAFGGHGLVRRIRPLTSREHRFGQTKDFLRAPLLVEHQDDGLSTCFFKGRHMGAGVAPQIPDPELRLRSDLLLPTLLCGRALEFGPCSAERLRICDVDIPGIGVPSGYRLARTLAPPTASRGGPISRGPRLAPARPKVSSSTRSPRHNAGSSRHAASSRRIRSEKGGNGIPRDS
jgi:hypothetical protein